jgi:hypothetical protein
MHVRMPRRNVLLHRLGEGLREVGVLFVALAPLDLAFGDRVGRLTATALFLVAGALFFVWGLVIEGADVESG